MPSVPRVRWALLDPVESVEIRESVEFQESREKEEFQDNRDCLAVMEPQEPRDRPGNPVSKDQGDHQDQEGPPEVRDPMA